MRSPGVRTGTPTQRLCIEIFMLWMLVLGVVIAVVLLAAWYSCFLHFNRRRGTLVLRWLEQAVAQHGLLGEVAWASPCRLQARLHLSSCDLHQPSAEVRLAPRHSPLLWALWYWRRQRETLSFQANLTCPPGESLEISRRRWTGPARNRRSRGAATDLSSETHPVATFYLSTQPTWKPLIVERMGSALSIAEVNFLAVSFHPAKPHFLVTLSLEEALRHRGAESPIFDSLRELAAGSSTSRM
jgi:hypothetical protein